MRQKIGILDSDQGYSVKLMEYVNYNYSENLNAVVFKNKESLQKYLSFDYIDLLLVNETNSEGIKASCPILYIVESHPKNRPGCIFKYQSADGIVRQILMHIDNNNQGIHKNKFFVGIFSPIGRCGKTELALGLCMNEDRALYIGLEDNVCIDRNLQLGTSLAHIESISASFMYYLATENKEMLGMFDVLPDMQRIKVLQVVGGGNDIRLISKENLLWFKELVSSHDLFSRVIVDIGADVLSDYNILRCFDQIYVPELIDDISMGKLRFFLQKQEALMYEISDRTRYIYVPDVFYDSQQMRDFINEYQL